MAPLQVSEFLTGATMEKCFINDNRVTDIMKYDKDKDGKIEREDFIEFYR